MIAHEKRDWSLGLLFIGLSMLALSLAMGALIPTLTPSIETEWFIPSSFGSVFFVCLIIGSATVWLTDWRHRRFLLFTFLIAFFVRVILAIVFYYYLLFYYGYNGFEMNDDWWWDFHGKLVASGGLAALQTQFSAGYILFNAVIYKLAGPYPLNVRVANALIGALIPLAGFHLSKRLFENDERLARRVATWLVWWPSQLVFSGLQQKDIVLALALTTGTLAIIQMYRDGVRLSSAMLFLGSLVIAASIRNFAADLLVLTAMFAAVHASYRNKRLFAGVWLLILVVGLASGIGYILQHVIGTGSVFAIQEQYLYRSEGIIHEVENAIWSQPSGVNSLLFGPLAPLRVVVGSVVFLVSPFPPAFTWQTNFSASLLSLATPLWFLLLPYIFVAIMRLIRKQRESMLLLVMLPVLATMVANAWLVSGTIPRQRVMVEPLIVLLAAWGFHISSPVQRWHCLLWSTALVSLSAGLYTFLRGLV